MVTYSVLRHLNLKLNGNAVPHCLKNTRLLPTVTAPLTSQLRTTEREFHTSEHNHVNHRKEKAVVKHLYYKNHEKSLGHSRSPLVELPDYTYQDGRPTEATISSKERQEKNYNLAKEVVRLVEEMKFAQNQLATQEEAKVRAEEKRRKSQLKQKGKML